MKTRALLVTILALLFLTTATSISAPLQATLTPQEILTRMADVYAKCSSYRDEGKVIQGGRVGLTFSTLFERPLLFRFEYTRTIGPGGQYVLWRTMPGDTQTWWTIRPEVQNRSMDLAIAGATGVSLATSHNIPALLMPDEVSGFSFARENWVDVKSAEEESVEGHPSYKISGHFPNVPTSLVTLWVDRETFLVRQVLSNGATVVYSPQVNVPIDKSLFQFQPPGASQAPVLPLVVPPVQSQAGTGVITGKIVAIDGGPAAGVRVGAVARADANAAATATSTATMVAGLAQTDGAGNYRLENVPAGSYYVTAGLVDLPTYYPGVSAPGTNSLVRVSAGATLTGVDFRLVQTTGLSVRGRLSGATSLPGAASPIRFGSVVLLPRTRGTILRAGIQSDLSFEFTNVQPGTYSVQLSVPGTLVLKETTTITLTSNNLADVLLPVIDSAIAITGTGMETAWNLSGSWRGIATDVNTGTLYAGSPQRLAQIDSAGNVRGETPVAAAPTLRLARFQGESSPVFLTFGTWSENVQAFDSKGKLLWTYPKAENLAQGIDDAWPIDLDGDQSDEVVVGFNGNTGLHVLNSKGEVLWTATGNIGNVWHVSGGDVHGDGKPVVVTTSAAGKVHIFSDNGKTRTDLNAGIYANMVRIGRIAAADTSETIVVGGSDSANNQANLVALGADGTIRWKVQLPSSGRPFIQSTYFAPAKSWIAVALQGGTIHVIDAERGAIIASADGQGQIPELAWLPVSGGDPLLVVSSPTRLTAFRITGRAASNVIPRESVPR